MMGIFFLTNRIYYASSLCSCHKLTNKYAETLSGVLILWCAHPPLISAAVRFLCELMWWKISDNSPSFLLSVSRPCPPMTLGPFSTPLIQWWLLWPFSAFLSLVLTNKHAIKPHIAWGFGCCNSSEILTDHSSDCEMRGWSSVEYWSLNMHLHVVIFILVIGDVNWFGCHGMVI